MQDGERVTVLGSTGTEYALSRKGDVYACSCPAWEKQRAAPALRTCKHLRARLGDDHEDRRVRARPQAPLREPRALRERREAVLARMLERFPAVAAKMRAVYDMPLPRHLAVALGFYGGLTPEEREEAWSYLGCGPAGVSEWFDDDGLSLPATADERLHFRYRCDPPEFVTIFSGNCDGSHWGLWYDDPRELPRLVAHNYARDDACTGARKPTLLGSLREQLYDRELRAGEYPHLARVRAWFDECYRQEQAVYRAEGIESPPPRSHACVAGMDPVIPGVALPPDLDGYAAQELRYKTFRERTTEAAPWIDRARRELAEGQPFRALFLGRELHYVDPDELRATAAELLIGAYRALGRDALAGVTRAHHDNRDLRSVGIYGPMPEPPPPPLVAAAREDRVDEIAALLAGGALAEEVAAALLAARSMAAIELLLPHATTAMLDARVAAAIATLTHLGGSPEVAVEHEAVIDRLLGRGASVLGALAQALAVGLGHRAEAWALQVDPRAVDAAGMTALHHAAGAGAAALVERLLARGAELEARDTEGRTPRDHARALWQERRAESLAVMALLSPAPVVVRSTTPTVGDTVMHDKFGAGIVEASEGEGAGQKLRIGFADGPRTLLARFVRPAP
jgi:hypothetical protein